MRGNLVAEQRREAALGLTQNLPTPYCGAPPPPHGWWLHWNLDPILLLLLALCGGTYLLGARRAGGSIPSWRKHCFVAGWLVGSLALISPLCPLSVSLFAARVGQHMILALAVAPLIVLGRPVSSYVVLARRLPTNPVGAARLGGPLAAVLFAAALWFWHAPGPYAATFASPVIYWVMHLSVFGAALLLWSALLDPPRVGAATIMSGLASTLQMTFLGALITLSPAPVYAPHFLTTAAWGLTPLADQQIGGLIMWAPGCSAFLVATLWSLARMLKTIEPAPRQAAL